MCSNQGPFWVVIPCSLVEFANVSAIFIIAIPWRWRQRGVPKRRQFSTSLYVVQPTDSHTARNRVLHMMFVCCQNPNMVQSANLVLPICPSAPNNTQILTLVNSQLDAQFLYFIISLLRPSTCVPDGHLQRVTIPDVVLIQFDLLMMNTTLLETCRGP